MEERPIIFNSEMVKAILDDRKTQTRRPMKVQPTNLPEGAYCDPYNKNYDHFTFWTKDHKMILGSGGNIKNTSHWRPPSGKPGDRLWVRETFGCFDRSSSMPIRSDEIVYRADREEYPDRIFSGWKPSIHMPRWASRITLEIPNVRVERVQDISQKDIIHGEGWDGTIHTECPEAWFIHLWNFIYAKKGYGWDVNPWVWVIEFERIQEAV